MERGSSIGNLRRNKNHIWFWCGLKSTSNFLYRNWNSNWLKINIIFWSLCLWKPSMRLARPSLEVAHKFWLNEVVRKERGKRQKQIEECVSIWNSVDHVLAYSSAGRCAFSTISIIWTFPYALFFQSTNETKSNRQCVDAWFEIMFNLFEDISFCIHFGRSTNPFER